MLNEHAGSIDTQCLILELDVYRGPSLADELSQIDKPSRHQAPTFVPPLELTGASQCFKPNLHFRCKISVT